MNPQCSDFARSPNVLAISYQSVNYALCASGKEIFYSPLDESLSFHWKSLSLGDDLGPSSVSSLSISPDLKFLLCIGPGKLYISRIRFIDKVPKISTVVVSQMDYDFSYCEWVSDHSFYIVSSISERFQWLFFHELLKDDSGLGLSISTYSGHRDELICGCYCDGSNFRIVSFESNKLNSQLSFSTGLFSSGNYIVTAKFQKDVECDITKNFRIISTKSVNSFLISALMFDQNHNRYFWSVFDISASLSNESSTISAISLGSNLFWYQGYRDLEYPRYSCSCICDSSRCFIVLEVMGFFIGIADLWNGSDKKSSTALRWIDCQPAFYHDFLVDRYSQKQCHLSNKHSTSFYFLGMPQPDQYAMKVIISSVKNVDVSSPLTYFESFLWLFSNDATARPSSITSYDYKKPFSALLSCSLPTKTLLEAVSKGGRTADNFHKHIATIPKFKDWDREYRVEDNNSTPCNQMIRYLFYKKFVPVLSMRTSICSYFEAVNGCYDDWYSSNLQTTNFWRHVNTRLLDCFCSVIGGYHWYQQALFRARGILESLDSLVSHVYVVKVALRNAIVGHSGYVDMLKLWILLKKNAIQYLSSIYSRCCKSTRMEFLTFDLLCLVWDMEQCSVPLSKAQFESQISEIDLFKTNVLNKVMSSLSRDLTFLLSWTEKIRENCVVRGSRAELIDPEDNDFVIPKFDIDNLSNDCRSEFSDDCSSIQKDTISSSKYSFSFSSDEESDDDDKVLSSRISNGSEAKTSIADKEIISSMFLLEEELGSSNEAMIAELVDCIDNGMEFIDRKCLSTSRQFSSLRRKSRNIIRKKITKALSVNRIESDINVLSSPLETSFSLNFSSPKSKNEIFQGSPPRSPYCDRDSIGSDKFSPVKSPPRSNMSDAPFPESGIFDQKGSVIDLTRLFNSFALWEARNNSKYPKGDSFEGIDLKKDVQSHCFSDLFDTGNKANTLFREDKESFSSPSRYASRCLPVISSPSKGKSGFDSEFWHGKFSTSIENVVREERSVTSKGSNDNFAAVEFSLLVTLFRSSSVRCASSSQSLIFQSLKSLEEAPLRLVNSSLDQCFLSAWNGYFENMEMAEFKESLSIDSNILETIRTQDQHWDEIARKEVDRKLVQLALEKTQKEELHVKEEEEEKYWRSQEKVDLPSMLPPKQTPPVKSSKATGNESRSTLAKPVNSKTAGTMMNAKAVNEVSNTNNASKPVKDIWGKATASNVVTKESTTTSGTLSSTRFSSAVVGVEPSNSSLGAPLDANNTATAASSSVGSSSSSFSSFSSAPQGSKSFSSSTFAESPISKTGFGVAAMASPDSTTTTTTAAGVGSGGFGQSNAGSGSRFGPSNDGSGGGFGQSNAGSGSSRFGPPNAGSGSGFGQSNAGSGSRFGPPNAGSGSGFGQTNAGSGSSGFGQQIKIQKPSKNIWGNTNSSEPVTSNSTSTKALNEASSNASAQQFSGMKFGSSNTTFGSNAANSTTTNSSSSSNNNSGGFNSMGSNFKFGNASKGVSSEGFANFRSSGEASAFGSSQSNAPSNTNPSGPSSGFSGLFSSSNLTDSSTKGSLFAPKTGISATGGFGTRSVVGINSNASLSSGFMPSNSGNNSSGMGGGQAMGNNAMGNMNGSSAMSTLVPSDFNREIPTFGSSISSPAPSSSLFSVSSSNAQGASSLMRSNNRPPPASPSTPGFGGLGLGRTSLFGNKGD